MRVLVAIPHYHNPDLQSGYGSTTDSADERADLLHRCLRGLRETCGSRQAYLLSMHPRTNDSGNGRLAKANFFSPVQMDIAVCTTGSTHVIGRGHLEPGNLFQHVQTSMKPHLLGFACHHLMRQMLGKYDFFCYMEDDLLVSDPLFFVKLAWFADRFGSGALLQPHRFETCDGSPIDKLYIDGPVHANFTSQWQNPADHPTLEAGVLGWTIAFHRTPNPHAGCFFLNASQMEDWTKQPYFLDGDTSFAGPLESAASLGIMKCFRIYKPAAEFAGFFEIHHLGRRYLNKRLHLPATADRPPA
jgi:hypothetical protein